MGSEILGLARYGLDPIAWRKVRVFWGVRVIFTFLCLCSEKGGGGGGRDGGVGGQDTAGLHCRTEGSSFER